MDLNYWIEKRLTTNEKLKVYMTSRQADWLAKWIRNPLNDKWSKTITNHVTDRQSVPPVKCDYVSGCYVKYIMIDRLSVRVSDFSFSHEDIFTDICHTTVITPPPKKSPAQFLSIIHWPFPSLYTSFSSTQWSKTEKMTWWYRRQKLITA